MTVAVTGATGFVGQALCEEAAREGVALKALTRREQDEAPGIEWVRGDLGDAAALARLVAGTQAVIHLAGLVSAPDAAAFEQANVEGTRRLIEAASAAGCGRFVFVSSLAAREPGLSVYGGSKRRAEQLVEGSGLDWTIVRPPAVYGPRDREMFEMFRAARWGLLPMPAHGRTSLIHVRDLAALLLALAAGGKGASGATFEPDDGAPGGYDHRALAKAIGGAVGRDPWVPRLSRGALMALARIDSALRGSKAKLTRDRAAYMAHPDWVCSADRQPPTELWQPSLSASEGLAQTAQWYRANGWL